MIMEKKTKLVLTRKSELLNALRGYRVVIDGEKRGKIGNGDTEEYEVTPGKHIVSCKVDWCGSRDYAFEVNEGEVAYLQVKNGARHFFYFFIPAIVLYIAYKFGDTAGERPYLLYALIFVGLAYIAYMLYYTVISRKDYLSIEKDSTTLFGK
jgi:hypothetical protein